MTENNNNSKKRLKRKSSDVAIIINDTNEKDGNENKEIPSWLLSLPEENGVFYHVVKFLDPGLDFPSCRLVHSSWNRHIQSFIAKVKETEIWMYPLHISDKHSYSDRVSMDFSMLRRTTEREKEMIRQLELSENANDENFDINVFETSPHFSWRRTDVVPDSNGYSYVDDGTAPFIASARVTLHVRNAFKLIDSKSMLESGYFSFCGSRWLFEVGAKKDYDNVWSFGIELFERWHKFPLPLQRCDPTNFSFTEDITSLIRYRAKFTAGYGTFSASDFESKWSRRRNNTSSFCTEYSGNGCDYFPLSVAAFALGPSNPDLRIVVELEHLGFGYNIC